ncbi:flagellar hook-basal body complex protein FliE [Geobacter benzoatilyticus]|jgi:flagellar hook-basal body complex protein FliE|uniref:Flagellar hook-basal body complex protein FliE n=1 Tax=Geobacter benzoatilyticus TaxID=2815309 RepID=A0ABX7Q5I0_9BACT|nr:flagellar hook-basal body complex protein FliE [Geobacter benzoatilyticus]QSV46355.1 flagellar hook-basal body complex protein FliE [Geobacter benzoatilyticus]
MIEGIESGIGIGKAFPDVGTKGAKPSSLVNDTGKFFGELVTKVNELQAQSDSAIQSLATGESQGLHEVMIAMEKSSIAFQFLGQVRNKAIDAYNEVMRMQV